MLRNAATRPTTKHGVSNANGGISTGLRSNDLRIEYCVPRNKRGDPPAPKVGGLPFGASPRAEASRRATNRLHSSEGGSGVRYGAGPGRAGQRRRHPKQLPPSEQQGARDTVSPVAVTWRGACKLSRTILSFSSSDQRRRRPVSTTSSRSIWR